MASVLTEITEISTAVGTLCFDIYTAFERRPAELLHVDDDVWARVRAAHLGRQHVALFRHAFENGRAFLQADEGLRNRRPILVEWKGSHRTLVESLVPVDLRIDHVYQISCKYLSAVLHNASPSRLFDRLLASDERTPIDWFGHVAPDEMQAFFLAARDHIGDATVPLNFSELERSHRDVMRQHLAARSLPEPLRQPWRDLCLAVGRESAQRWQGNLSTNRARLRMLWRLLRISDAPYFVLGADKNTHIRLRVSSAWDWDRQFELLAFDVSGNDVGQPEVAWRALVADRSTRDPTEIRGHVEIRWSHGRFQGHPEAKVYLDTPHAQVPGYWPLR
jgi:hypothetical protein